MKCKRDKPGKHRRLGSFTLLFTSLISLAQVGYFLFCLLLVYPESYALLGKRVAKSSAKVIDVDMALVLIPVLRKTFSLFTNSGLVRLRLFAEHNLRSVHMVLGVSICFWSTVHITAHYTSEYKPMHLTVVTGSIMAVFLGAVFASALPTVRKHSFGLFWGIHRFANVLFIGSVLHRGFCYFDNCNEQFVHQMRTNWWVYIGLALYLCDTLIRMITIRQPTWISSIIKHPHRVVEVRIMKPNFRYSEGQYIFVRCKSISAIEWHPFTITSSPIENYISIHFHIVGDWTEQFARSLGCVYRDERPGHLDQNDELTVPTFPEVSIDGPYGSSFKGWRTFETVLVIGTNIGITPFASMLKTLWYSIQCTPPNDNTVKVHKFHLVWICKSVTSATWMQQVFDALNDEETGGGIRGFLTLEVYITAAMDIDQINNLHLNQNSLSMLHATTYFGRPNLDTIFKRVLDEPRKDAPDSQKPTVANTEPAAAHVGVFFCGKASLGRLIEDKCNNYSTDRTRFAFHSEIM